MGSFVLLITQKQRPKNSQVRCRAEDTRPNETNLSDQSLNHFFKKDYCSQHFFPAQIRDE
jgi:hypothetical protein